MISARWNFTRGVEAGVFVKWGAGYLARSGPAPLRAFFTVCA